MDSKIRLVFQILTWSGTFFAWITALAISFAINEDTRPEVLSLTFILLVLLIPVFIIKQTVRRNRPEYKDDRFGTTAFDKFSFPSGHAARASWAMISMPLVTPNLTFFWIIWGIIMITSRLILGVHYISDIIAGIIIGSLSIIIIISLGWIPVVPFIENLGWI